MKKSIFLFLLFLCDASFSSQHSLEKAALVPAACAHNFFVPSRKRDHLGQQKLNWCSDMSGWMHAARNGNLPRMASIIGKSKIDIDSRTNMGRTALHEAANHGKTEAARLLLEHKADPSAQDSRGWTPLHCAVGRGYMPVVKELCYAEADLELTTDKGWSALSLAVGENKIDIAMFLISLGANLEVADKHGWRPLHIACDRGDRRMVSSLLQQGASLRVWTSPRSGSRNPLTIVTAKNRVDIMSDILSFLCHTQVSNYICNDQATKCYYETLRIPDYSRIVLIAKGQELTEMASLFDFFSQNLITLGRYFGYFV